VVIAGFQFAAPVIAILLLTNLLTGLVSRTLPQINLLVVGLSLNALALLAGLSVTIGSAGWLFQSELVRAIEGLSNVW
jgi:flagellar biosynthetic protein FliR